MENHVIEGINWKRVYHVIFVEIEAEFRKKQYLFLKPHSNSCLRYQGLKGFVVADEFERRPFMAIRR